MTPAGRITALALLLAAAAWASTPVICPEHGVRSVPTGNRKWAGPRNSVCYEMYRHPQGAGLHEFWDRCN